MRTLVHIPTIHDVSDINPRNLHRIGASNRIIIQHFANKAWETTENEVGSQNFAGARIYSESISVDDVSALKRKYPIGLGEKFLNAKSRQARLLGKLIQDGAILEGIENDRWYKAHVWQLQRGTAGKTFTGTMLYTTLKKLRDRHIAQRIDDTLQDGETGILIIGAGHNVQRYLNRDINVVPLSEELLQLKREFFAEANARELEGNRRFERR